MNEFDVIVRYFAPLTMGRAESAGLTDDAAVLSVSAGQELVVTTDTLNEGTHFWPGEAPEFIARKALRVNLSDLAAMGAAPYAYQLAIAFPEKPDEKWLQKFSAALLEDQKQFGIFCSGGDTTSINGSLSITITAMGLVPAGKAVRRGGAKPGDMIMLSGPVGDAWIGLQCLRDKLKTDRADYFIEKYKMPVPRFDMAEAVRVYAHAAIDISDGLVADIGQICKASGCGAKITVSDAMFSENARALLQAGVVTAQDLLSGGDDYELLLAAAQSATAHFPQGLVIGRFVAGEPAVNIVDSQGTPLSFSQKGWTHF